jgi:hypothetical protein
MVALSNYHDMYAAIDSNYKSGYDYLPEVKQNELTVVKNLDNVSAFQPINRNIAKRSDTIYITYEFQGNGTNFIQNSVGLYGSVTVMGDEMSTNVNQDPRDSGDTIVFSANGSVYRGGSQVEVDVPIVFTNTVTMEIKMANGFTSARVTIAGEDWGDYVGPAQQFDGIDPSPKWIPFISVDHQEVGSIATPNTDIVSQRWIRPAGTIQEFGKLFLRTSTAVGVSWSAHPLLINGSYKIYNSDTDVDVQDGQTGTNPFYRFTDLQPDTFYNIFYTPDGDDEFNLLNGVKTSGTKVLFKFTGSFDSNGNVLVPISDIESLSTPYLIAIESMQIVHDASYLPINAYKLVSEDIGFEQYINYNGGKTLNYISPVADTNLGTQLPVVLKTGQYENPGHITFKMSYDTVIGTNIPAQLINYSQVTFVVYTGQLYLFGIN